MSSRRFGRPLRLAGALLVCAVLSRCGSGAGGGGRPEADRAARPSIVFVLLDDLGYFDLGCYGSPDVKTPHIDRLAAEGTRFTAYHVNSPVCSPSRAAILTGRYPQRYNITEVLTPISDRGIPGGVTTLPEVLKARGYATGHFGKWHVGESRAEFLPQNHGFDESARISFDSSNGYFDPILHLDGDTTVQEKGHETAILTTRAEDFIRRHRDAPFFLNLWYSAPHDPYQPPPEWKDKYPSDLRGRYLALIADVDEKIGNLMDLLDELGIAKDTIVIFASDNGGQRRALGDGLDLRGSKSELFEGGIRVPLIVRWPGKVPAGRVDASTVLGFDLLPTLAEITGADVTKQPLDGKSFAPLLLGRGDAPPRDELFWSKRQRAEPGTESYAVRDGGWKLLFEYGTRYLFDFGASGAGLPAEQDSEDVSAAHPDVVAKLLADYDAWRVRTGILSWRVAELSGSARTGDVGTFEFPAPGGAVALQPDRLFSFNDGDFTVSASVRLAKGPRGLDAAGAGAVLATKPGSWTLSIVPGPRIEARWTLAPPPPGKAGAPAGEGGAPPGETGAAPSAEGAAAGAEGVQSGEAGIQTKAGGAPPGEAVLLSPILRWKAGEWHEIATTAYGPTPRSTDTLFQLWVDGHELARTIQSLPVASSDTAVVLGNSDAADRPFEGALKNIGFFAAPLSEAQLRVFAEEGSKKRP